MDPKKSLSTSLTPQQPPASKLSASFATGTKLSVTAQALPKTGETTVMADGAKRIDGRGSQLRTSHALAVGDAQEAQRKSSVSDLERKVADLPELGQGHSKGRRRTTVTIDQQLTTDRLVRFQRQFQEADADQGGSISMEEFRNALKKTIGYHVTDEEADMIFMKVDSNCDGIIDWEEYLSYVLLECRERDLMRIMAREPYNRETRFCRAENREVIVALHFIPSPTGGRYLSASREGMLTFWTKNFTSPLTQRVVKGAVGSTPIWVTAVEIALEARLIIVATSNYDLTWYFYGTKSLERISRIHQLPGSVMSMSFYTEAHHEGSNRISYLAWGDEYGGLGVIIFSRCPSKTDVGNPNQTDEEKRKKKPRATRYFFFTDISNGNVPSLGARYHETVHNRYVRQVRYIQRMRCWLSCAKDTASAFLLSDLIHEMTARPQFWTVEHGVNAFDYCEKLNVIVTGGFDTVIRLWNPLAEDSKLVGFLKGHISPVTHLMVNHRQENLVSLGENKDILVFDLNTTHCIQTLLRKVLRPMGTRPFSAALLHQSINRVVLATKSIAIITSRTDDSSAAMMSAGTERIVTAMLYNSLFKQVVTGDERSRVSVYDVFTGEKIMQFTVHTIMENGTAIEAEITAMCFDPTRRRLATGTRDGTVKIWNYNNGTMLRELPPTVPRTEITGIVWPPTRILVGGWSKRVMAFLESADNNEFRTFKPSHEGDILCVNVFPPRMAISASVDGNIMVWSLDTSYPLFMYSSLFPDKMASANFYNSQQQDGSDERKSGKKDAGVQNFFRASAGWNLEPSRKSYWDVGGSDGTQPTQGRNPLGVNEESPVLGTTPFNASIEAMLVLSRRELADDVAVLLTCLTNGHVLAWPLTIKGKCLGDFFAASAKGESINCADVTEDNEFLVTGDSAGYVKVWDISHYRCGAHGPSCCAETDALREPVWKEFPYVRMRLITDTLRMARRRNLPLHLKCKCTATDEGPLSDAIDANPPHLVNCLYVHLGSLVEVVVAKVNSSYIIATASTDYSVRLWTIQGQFLGIFGGQDQWRNIRSLSPFAQPSKTTSAAAKGESPGDSTLPRVVDPGIDSSIRNSYRIPLPMDLRRVASYTTLFILETEANTRRKSRWSFVRNAAAWICAFLQSRRPTFINEEKPPPSTFAIPGARPEKVAPYSNNLREMIDEYEKGAMANTGFKRKQQQDLRAQAAERDANLLRPLPPQTSSVLGKAYHKPTQHRPIQRLNLDESIGGEVSPYRALPYLDIVQQPMAEMLSSPAVSSIQETHYLPPIDQDIGLNISRKPSDPILRMMQALRRAGWALKSDLQLQRRRVPINGPFRKSMIMIPSLGLLSDEELRRQTVAARKSSHLAPGARLSKAKSRKWNDN